MTYRHYAEKLMDYMILGEERGRIVQKNIAELSHGKMEVLRFLLKQDGMVSAGEISKKLKISTGRVAAILNSLENQGYINRNWSREDRRRTEITITDKGKQFIKERQEKYLSYCMNMLKQLGQRDSKTYVRILKRLSEMLPETEKKQKQML